MPELQGQFKENTAYMEVPRCDQCRWWKRYAGLNGECTYISYDNRPPGAIRNNKATAKVLYTLASFGCTEQEKL